MPPNEPPRSLTASMISPMVAGNGNFQNNIDKSNLEPTTYTLQFSILDIEPWLRDAFHVIPEKFFPLVQAIITWKVNGQHQRRVISVVSGAAISAVAEGVDVKLVDVTGENRDTSNRPIGYKYKVQVTLSRGVRSSVEQPPTLMDGEGVQFISNNAGNTDAMFPVPDDAGVISVYPFIAYRTNDSSLVFNKSVLKMLYLDRVLIDTYGISQPPAEGWVPLIPGTGVVVFQFANTAGPPPVELDVAVSVLWGIEG